MALERGTRLGPYQIESPHRGFEARCVPLLALVLLAVPTAAQEPVAVEVARLPSYTEGVVVDRDGNLFVSEPFSRNISRITQDGDVSRARF